MNFSRLSRLLDGSVGVGRLFGIPIRLHLTLLFFLLPAFAGRSFGLGYTLEWIAGIVLSILLHELGHALTAKRFGLGGLSITLHGFGGFASSSGPRTPRQALLISLAGPGVTFLIGVLGLAAGGLGSGASELGSEAWLQFVLLHALGALNVSLGFLNLIPSLPWDGGHALQAILAHRMSERKSMRAVAHLGLVLCPILLVVGLTTDRSYFELFGFVGLLTSYFTLTQSGGVRFGEVFADRRHRKEMEAVKRRETAKAEAFLADVNLRQREREEKERLRQLFERSGLDGEGQTPFDSPGEP